MKGTTAVAKDVLKTRRTDERWSLVLDSKKERDIAMTYSVVIVSKDRISGDRHFFVRELERHFNSYLQQGRAGWFSLKWIGNILVLSTSSAYLLGQWWATERHFVEFLLQPADLDAEALECPWDFLYPSAA